MFDKYNIKAEIVKISNLKFNSDGLIPVVVQDVKKGDVLMMAWMNQDSINKTISTSRMTYWSRSRKCEWIKGLTSGNTQTLVELRADCDQDCLLALVDQKGVACHTGRRSCFYIPLNSKKAVESK